MGNLGLPPSLTPVLTSACSLAFSGQASVVAGLLGTRGATCTVTARGSDWHKQGGAFPRTRCLSKESFREGEASTPTAADGPPLPTFLEAC